MNLKIENYNPIIITSPVRRSGTTLLQRLLSSSSDTLIYGESCASDFQMLTNLYLGKLLLLQQGKSWRNEQLESVLSGDVNDWIPDLMPDIDSYLSNFKKNAIQLLQFYASFAQKQQRPIWGMKLPEWNPANLIQLRQLFPEIKIIFLTRNLEDCVRSAKKVDMVRTLPEIEQYSYTWQQHIQMARQHFEGKHVFNISYESLIQNPKPILKELESFTHSKNIDATVLDFKFNSFKSTIAENESFGEYTFPSDLTEEEMTIVKKYETHTLTPISI